MCKTNKKNQWNVCSLQNYISMIDGHLFSKLQKTPSAHITSFFITSVHFLYIIHRFAPFLHYKIRIIFLICKTEEGKKEVRVECNVFFLIYCLIKPSDFFFLLTLHPDTLVLFSWSVLDVGLWKKKKKNPQNPAVFGEKSTALIKFVLFSSFCRSTYSLALIKIILLSSYRRITHHFPTTLIRR